jgi:restriction endonuclease S subunit
LRAEVLLVTFDRISEAVNSPGALQHVIAELAFQGRLHCPAEREWPRKRLGEIAEIIMGQSPPGSTYNKEGIGLPLINGPVEFTAGPFGRTVINQYTTAPTKTCAEDDLLVCVRGSTTGRTNLAAFDACIGRGVAAIRPTCGTTFVYRYIAHQRASIIAMGRGIAFPSVSRDQLTDLLVPWPTPEEQEEVVATIDDLLALCDELKASQYARDETRDRFRAASLARLTAPTVTPGKVARQDATFFLSHSDRMVTKPAHVADLRRAILDLAVTGRIVPQIDSEPQLFAPHATAVDRKLESPTSDETLPEKWLLGPMGRWFVVSGGIQKQPKRVPNEHPYPYVGVANVQRGRLELGVVKQFELFPGELDKYRLVAGDLLVVEGNGSVDEVGRCSVWRGEIADCVHQNHIIRCRPRLSDVEEFTLLYLNSPRGIAEMTRLAVTTAGLYNLSVGKIQRIMIPMPPLPEQKRIVAKVNELMAVCDEFERALRSAETGRAKLLEAVLHEALNGRAVEAALAEATA